MNTDEKKDIMNARIAGRDETATQVLKNSTLPEVQPPKDGGDVASIASTQTEPREHNDSTEPPSKGQRLLHIFKGPTDDTDPIQYSARKKGMILFIISVAGGMSPIASTIYYPSLAQVREDFDTTETAVNASVSTFVFLTAFFPLFWATWSEVHGRRRVYLVSFALSVIGSVLCGLSRHIAMLIVFRGLSAAGTSSVMSMGAGSLSDVFEAHERGRAYSWYVLGPILGPAIGPIIGGYLTEAFGWQSVFWFLALLIFGVWCMIFFFLPETFRKSEKPVSDLNMAEEGKQTEEKKRRKCVRGINPLGPLVLLRYPNVTLPCLYIGLIFGVYYLLNTTFTWSFSQTYGLDSGLVGACYIPNAVGGVVGGNFGGRISDYIYNRNVAKARIAGKPVTPEMRLSMMVLVPAAFLLAASLVAYGWTVYYEVHYAVPIVMTFSATLGVMLPHVTFNAYLVDCHRRKGASVTACNNLSRYLFSGVCCLLASDFVNALGNGVLYSGCAILILLFGLPIFYVKANPNKWHSMREKLEKQ